MVATFALAIGTPITIGNNKTNEIIAPMDGTITKAYARAKTGPTDADLIFDINLNGSTIWATQGNRLKIVDGNTTGTETSFDTTAVSEGDYFSIDVDQVGSTIAGQDVTVELSILSTGISGYSGYSGISGYSGPSGYSGYSGISGYSGYSGTLANVIDDTTPELGGNLDVNDFSIQYTVVPTSDQTANGIIITLTAKAANNFTFGEVGYIDATGNVVEAVASAIATSGAIVMAMDTIAAEASGSWLLHGIARDDAWTWTVGGLVYLDATTPAAMTQTAPSGVNNVVQVLGVATHADRMYFNPSLVMIEHV